LKDYEMVDKAKMNEFSWRIMLVSFSIRIFPSIENGIFLLKVAEK